MHVLHVHTSDYHGGGGGAISMYRLHRGLLNCGVNSRILCANKTIHSDESVAIPQLHCYERFLQKLTSRFGFNDIHCLNSFKLPQMSAVQQADIINLHSFRNFFSYLALPQLSAAKPIVFTMCDMWPWTGHCAVSYDCNRWETGCGSCPYLDVIPEIPHDTTRLVWRLKNWAYSHSKMTIVAKSRASAAEIRRSMLSKFPVAVIPNGVDLSAFRPLNQQVCKDILNLPQGKKVLMFGALDMSQYWKGADLLLEALKNLPQSLRKDLVLLLLGAGGGDLTEATGLPVYDLHYVVNDCLKAVAYSAADIFVSPTRSETFGLVLLESMACGTPVVAFGVGGVLDLVRPGITGYRAEAENAEDLKNGIEHLLADKKLRLELGKGARCVAESEYDVRLQVNRSLALYQSVLEGRDYTQLLQEHNVAAFKEQPAGKQVLQPHELTVAE